MRTLLFYLLFTIMTILNIIANLFVFLYYLPSDFVRAQKIAFKSMLSKIPHMGRKKLPLWFDDNGLRYDINHLRSISLKEFVLLEDKDLSHYVDEVTHKICKDKTTGSKIEIFTEESFNMLNATSIGNIAYLSLHHPNEFERHIAGNVLHAIRDHYKNSSK